MADRVLTYRADTVGTIRTLLAGYSGGITIVREMAQNTDDVPGDDDRWLEFHFNANELVIKNSTTFRPVDFDNIINIAHGGKKQENRNTIGMFGVGFVSVFQLTDTPILRSSGRELRFVPEHGSVYEGTSEVVEHTEFELPYRRVRSAVGDRLGMPEVTDAWMRDTLRALPDEAYRLLFFLRRLKRIAVYQEGRLVRDVRRTVKPNSEPEHPEILEITFRDGEETSAQHHWFRFTHEIAQVSEATDASKDRHVHIVIPDTDVPESWWRDNSSGYLYNYLPTDLKTGLPFQINGDFYPSADRKNINNDHPNQARWNDQVLQGIGDCLARALQWLLQHFAAVPLQLYQRLPIKKVSPLVAPIRERFFTAAQPLPIFHTVSGWQQAEQTRWVTEKLRPVVEGVDPGLMEADLQTAAWELITELGVRKYTLSDFLRRLRSDVANGDMLADGPWYFSSWKHVEVLYAALEQDWARDFDEMIAQAPVFVDHTGRVWPAQECVRQPEPTIREALAESGLHFWVGDTRKFYHTAALVPEFSLAHLWRELRRQLPGEMLLKDAPAWLNSRPKLYQLYATIIKIHAPIDKASVAQLPLCLNRDERLCRPSTLFMPDGEPILYQIFEDDPEAPLISRSTQDKKEYRQFYDALGVKIFDWKMVLERLGKLVRRESHIDNVHAVVNTPEKLQHVYQYLLKHHQSFERKDIEEVRHRLPIWLCRDNVLRIAKDLALPPVTQNWPPCINVDKVLKIVERLGPLLTDTLNLKPLNANVFIEKYLLQQYADLPRPQQLEALKYLRAQQEVLAADTALLQLVKATPLLAGEDDRLYPAATLCFPDKELRELFSGHVRLLHQLYLAGTSHVRESQWYTLFQLLGVHHLAPASVVEAQIRTLIQQPPSTTGDAIEGIFWYLEKHWESYYGKALGARLRGFPWLPADGDGRQWYRPTELYPILEKRLVDQVAKVLGFRRAIRPQAAIADVLEFPRANTKIMVRQLLALSRIGAAPHPSLYDNLNHETVTSEDLKPLRGEAVVYDQERQRYWRADHIFLSNQRKEFGSYRLSLEDSEFKRFLSRVGAKTAPVYKDYLALLLEISEKSRENIADEDVNLLQRAYAALSDAPDELLAPLGGVPCVLSKAGEEPLALRLPHSVVLRPADRYVRHLRGLPIAQYGPDGVRTLEAIGVRALEDVLQTMFRLEKDRSRPVPLTQLGHLNHAIRRLLFHINQFEREQDVVAQLQQLCCYQMSAIHVVYHVELATETISSNLLNEDMFYDPRAQEVYLKYPLSEEDTHWALAQVLEQVLGADVFNPSLLKDIIAEPRRVNDLLDKNHIKPLPDELNVAAIDETPDTLRLGIALEGTPEELFAQQTVATFGHAGARSDEAEFFHQIHVDMPFTPVQEATTNGSVHEPVAQVPMGGSPSPASASSVSRPVSSPGSKEDIGQNGGKASNGHRPTKASAEPPTEQRVPSGAKAVSLVTPYHPHAPRFAGRTVLSSPAIQTDMDRLRDQVRSWAKEQGLPTSVIASSPQLPPPQPRKRAEAVRELEEPNVARFVLSYLERTDGFLFINTQARELFNERPPHATCETEYNHAFDLWFDWQRDKPIVYNQAGLAAFFEEQEIPAGGVVYLERLHGSHYRLFYRSDPHKVREVRIAANEQGVVHYHIIDEVEVHCETDDAIYRAEKRHEDQEALWLEAANKKSVVETLCDLFMTSREAWLHEDDLSMMLNTIRMVAASTVQQELNKQPFFKTDGGGYWRLDPAALLAASQDTVILHWQKAMRRLLESDDEMLAGALDVIRPPVDDLRRRIIQLEPIGSASNASTDLSTIVDTLNADPISSLAAHSLGQVLRQRVWASDVDLLTDSLFREILRAVGQAVWDRVLRPMLRDEFNDLRHAEQYERAALLAQSWADFDPQHGLDLQQAVRDAEAWKIIAAPQPEPVAIADALRRAPTLTLGRVKLHAAAQLTLRQHLPEHWLEQGDEAAAVTAFYAHVAALGSVRAELEQANQVAFDRTVQLEADKLWDLIGDRARLQLVLDLKKHIGAMKPSRKQVKHLLGAAVGEQQYDMILSLLLGLHAWKLCAEDEHLQAQIAKHLVRCHSDLGIWELARNRPWWHVLSQDTRNEVWARGEQHRSTHLHREQTFLRQLDQWSHAYAALLDEARQELRHLVSRDIELLASSEM